MSNLGTLVGKSVFPTSVWIRSSVRIFVWLFVYSSCSAPPKVGRDPRMYFEALEVDCKVEFSGCELSGEPRTHHSPIFGPLAYTLVYVSGSRVRGGIILTRLDRMQPIQFQDSIAGYQRMPVQAMPLQILLFFL